MSSLYDLQREKLMNAFFSLEESITFRLNEWLLRLQWGYVLPSFFLSEATEQHYSMKHGLAV